MTTKKQTSIKTNNHEVAAKSSLESLVLAFLGFKVALVLVWLLIGQALNLAPGTKSAQAKTAAPPLTLAAVVNSQNSLPILAGAASALGQPTSAVSKNNNSGKSAQPSDSSFKPSWGAKEAWAQTTPPPANTTTSTPAGTGQPPAAGANKPSATPPPATTSLPGLSTEKDLARREMSLNAKEKALASLEEDLNIKLKNIESSKAEMENLVKRNEAILAEQKNLKTAQDAQDEQLKNARIEHLVTAYRSMRPEQAGNLVNSMDDDVAVAILSTMPGRSAGLILANVSPDKAARLTKAISERRIDPNLLLNEAAKGLPPTQ